MISDLTETEDVTTARILAPSAYQRVRVNKVIDSEFAAQDTVAMIQTDNFKK